MPGAPGSSSRGRGGKFRKFTRGGGKHFSRNLQPIDSEGNPVSIWSKDGKQREENSSEESEEESEEESSEEETNQTAAAQASADANREDRKAQKKARKEAAIAKQKALTVEVGDLPPSSDEESEEDLPLPANPNHSSSARKQASKVADPVEEITAGVKRLPASRREREAADAAAAKERYMKLHAEGKTDEAKADIARLKAIRAQREADAARRQAEKEERDEREKERRTEIDAREAKLRALAAGPKKVSKKK